MKMTDPTKLSTFSSYLPAAFRADGPYGNIIKKVDSLYRSVKEFLKHNLAWLKETGGVKALLIRFPDAIVSISNRIGPATLSGRIINRVADILMPLQALGGCASSLLGFAEVGSKFPAMFNSSEKQVQYVVRDSKDKTYRKQFPLNYWEQKANEALSVADWTLSLTGCAGYIWRLNHTAAEKFPLAPIATWSARYMSLKGLYSEFRFLYKTWLMHESTVIDKTRTNYDKEKGPVTVIYIENPAVAWEEIAGSALKISLSVACLSLDLFKTLASNGNQSPWLDTAIFCAGLAPTFITPVAMRYWPKMKTEPLYAAASA